MNTEVKTRGPLCMQCHSPKDNRFCKNCKKDTSNHFTVEAHSTVKATATMSATVKRGDVSIVYFVAVYGVIVTILTAAVAVLDLGAAIKSALIIAVSLLLFKIVFYSSKTRNFIIGLILKIKNYEEVH